MSSVVMLFNIQFIVLYFNKYSAEKNNSDFYAKTHGNIRYFILYMQCYVFYDVNWFVIS